MPKLKDNGQIAISKEIAVSPNDVLENTLICPESLSPKGTYFISYRYLSRISNPLYEDSKTPIPFRVKVPLSDTVIDVSRSVLSIKHNNVDGIDTPKSGTKGRQKGRYADIHKPMIMISQPKYITNLVKRTHDMNTGEVMASELIQTNDTKARLNRRNKSLNAFINHFEARYRAKKLTALFMTFTIANENGVELRTVIDQFKKRCQRNGYPCLGYFWVMEISKKLHVHYHAVFYIDYMDIKRKRLPKWWKLDELWGARTNVTMVKLSVRAYLSKYLEKGEKKIEGKRMYGKSILKLKLK